MSDYDETEWDEGPASMREMELLEEIRQTADSVVYRAVRGEREYDVRISRERTAPDSGRLQEFRRDAAIHASLEHPLIPTSYNVGVHEGRAFVVNESVRGETLQEWLDGEVLSEKMAVVIGGAVAGALAEIHEQGLVHGDLDPHRIVLTEQGEIKLLDYGLAGISETASRATRPVGDPRYGAPECVGDLKRPIDGRADLYALGLVLFEFVAGGFPLQDGEVDSVASVEARTIPPLAEAAPHVSPAFAAIVDRLVCVDPDDRYQSARRLEADFGRLDELNDRHAQGADLRLGTAGPVERPEDARAFVGREQEVETIRRIWREVQDGPGQFLVVEGAAGTGKTCLMKEVCREVVGDASRLVHGRCRDASPVPFVPLRVGLERYAGELAAASESEEGGAAEILAEAAAPFGGLLQSISPVLAELIDDEPALVSREAHEVFYNAFASLFADLAAELGALLIWIDDAQWMGEATLDVLRLLAQRLEDHPILLVFSGRNNSAAGSRLDRLVDEIGSRSPTRLELGGFDAEDASRLIGKELGDSHARGPWVETLARRSGGNPFLLHQQIRLLRDHGMLAPHWDGWTIDEEHIETSRAYREPVDWVAHRMETMASGVRRVLAVGSVLGHAFSLAQLRFACREVDSPLVHRAIQVGLRAEFLVRDSESGAYRFAHDRIRELFFSRLDDAEIRRTRRRAAEFLDTLEEPTVAQVYERARHYLAVDDEGDLQAITDALWAAGRRAIEEFAFEDAFRFLRGIERREAVEHLGEPTEFYELFGRACFRTSRLEQAVVSFRQAFRGADDALRKASLRAEVAKTKIRALDDREARREMARAFDELGVRLPTARWSFAPLIVLQLVGHWLVTTLLVWTGWWAGSASGTRRTRYRTLANLYEVGWRVGYFSRDKEFLLQSAVYGLRPAHYLGPSREFCVGYSNYAATLALSGRSSSARRYGERALETAERVADRQTLGFTRFMCGVVDSLDGRLEAAIERERELLDHRPEWLDATTFNLVCFDLATNYLLQGKSREGYRVSRMAIDRIRHRSGPYWAVYRLLALGRLAMFAAMQGRFREAERLEERLFEAAEQVPRDRPLPWLGVWSFLAAVRYQRRQWGEEFETVVERHREFDVPPAKSVHHSKHFYVVQAYVRREQAAQQARSTEALEEAIGELEEASSNETLRAHLLAASAGRARLAGDWNEAEEWIDRSVRLAEEVDNAWARFEALCQRAELRLDRRRESAARRAAEEARDLAVALGWSHRVERLERRFELASESTREPSSSWSDEASGANPSASLPDALPAGSSNSVKAACGSERMAALAAFTYSASARSGREGRICEILDGLLQFVGGTRGYLFVPEATGASYRCLRGRDRPGFDLEPPSIFAESLVDRVFRQEEPVATGRTPDQARERPENACAMGIPPFVEAEDPSAVVYVENLDGGAILEHVDLETLLMFAVTAAGLLRVSRLEEGSRHRASGEWSRRLVAANRELMQICGREQTRRSALEAFVDLIRRELPAAHVRARWSGPAEGEALECGDAVVSDLEALLDGGDQIGAKWRGGGEGGARAVQTGEEGRVAAVASRLAGGRQPAGVVVVERSAERAFSRVEIELLRTFGAGFQVIESRFDE